MSDHVLPAGASRVADHLLGRVCTGVGVGIAIHGTGRFPDLGDHDDGVPRFLMCLRGDLRTTPDGPGVRNDPNCWDFPGGAIEFGELAELAAVREAAEELGVKISSADPLGFVQQIRRGHGGRVEEHWVSLTHLCRLAPNSPPPAVPAPERTKLVGLRYFSLSEMEGLPLASSMPPNIQLIRSRRPDLVA